MEYSFLLAGELFDEKIRQSAAPFWETPNCPRNIKYVVPLFVGDYSVEKVD
jgi:hypothetical protein